MTTRKPVPLLRGQGRAVAAVCAGGVLGACARYGAGLLRPTARDGFPWTTLLVNAVGCALIGVVLVALTEGRRAPHPLLRPFLATGVLGGFTTFSTYAVDAQQLFGHGVPGRALLYLAGTLLAALAAVRAAASATRAVLSAYGGRAGAG
ncbi:CrcB family protein [Kitasatospora sp. NA04385]|uniref:fluoride efflux transporter FluC n=1 Tax=Kitasatospora sp. NA04385 TaxID=2742135 RepID=UPI00158FF9C6|nr:CrcB family protein [Kitasatospora sp. NA04385]QKW20923.1 CrcB family protein [Kitasatospora sp. NA04385]